MSKQLNREEAWALLTEYNQDPFHLHHARTVEQEVRSFLIKVAGLQPSKQRGAAHGALDNAVFDFDIANLPRSK